MRDPQRCLEPVILDFSNENTELSFKATANLQPSFRGGLKNEFDVRNERN